MRMLLVILTIVARITALLSLIPTVSAFLYLIRNPSGSVGVYGYRNSLEEPWLHPMTFSGLVGLIIAVVVIPGVPLCVGVTLMRRSPARRCAAAYALLALWLAAWVYGFGRMAITFGEGSDGWRLAGLGLSTLALAGAAVGTLNAVRRARASALDAG